MEELLTPEEHNHRNNPIQSNVPAENILLPVIPENGQSVENKDRGENVEDVNKVNKVEETNSMQAQMREILPEQVEQQIKQDMKQQNCQQNSSNIPLADCFGQEFRISTQMEAERMQKEEEPIFPLETGTSQEMLMGNQTDENQEFYLPLQNSEIPQIEEAYPVDDEQQIQQIPLPSRPRPKFICSNCSTNARWREAKYVNLRDFKTRRFLCARCLNTKQNPFVLPLSTSQLEPNDISNFMRRITANKNHPKGQQFKDSIIKMYEQDVLTKIRLLNNRQNAAIKKLERNISMQSLAAAHTFDDIPTICMFVDMVRSSEGTVEEEGKLEMLANAFVCSGKGNFNDPLMLMEAIKNCFDKVGKLIDRQAKDMESRLQYLNSEFNHLKISKIYDLLKKNQHPVRQRKLAVEPNMRHVGREQNPIQLDVEEEQRERTELKLRQSNIHSSPPSSDVNSSRLPSAQFNPTSILKQGSGGQPRNTAARKVTFKPDINAIPRYPTLQGRQLPQQNPVLVLLEVTIDNTSQIWHQNQQLAQTTQKMVINFQGDPQKAFRYLPSFNRLQQIVIFDPKMAEKDMVLFMFREISMLRRLELNCWNDWSREKIEELARQPLAKEIQTLFYGSNYHRNMAKLDERKWFAQHNFEERKTPLDNPTTQQILSLFPRLQNIWLQSPTPQLMQRIRERGNIRHLTIGLQDQQSPYQTIERQVWDMISKTKGLISLVLYKIDIDNDYLKELFIWNRQSLETICLFDCRNLGYMITNVMRDNLINVKELSLFKCGDHDFTGQHLWNMSSLETLILRECPKMDVHRAEMNIKNLIHLKYINLNGCAWLTDDLVGRIALLPVIQSINVGSTPIGNQSAVHLRAAGKNLRALHIGYTKIKGIVLGEQLLPEIRYLKKLSLKGLGSSEAGSSRPAFSNKQIQSILKKLESLTHLDISCCTSFDDTIFDFIRNTLKFLNITRATGISKGKKGDLTRRGIHLIDEGRYQ